jgi:hypothetical protein
MKSSMKKPGTMPSDEALLDMLIDAGQHDAPSEERSRALLLALGAGAAVTVGSATTALAGAPAATVASTASTSIAPAAVLTTAGAAPAAGASMGAASWGLGSAAVKWVAGGLLASSLAGGVYLSNTPNGGSANVSTAVASGAASAPRPSLTVRQPAYVTEPARVIESAQVNEAMPIAAPIVVSSSASAQAATVQAATAQAAPILNPVMTRMMAEPSAAATVQAQVPELAAAVQPMPTRVTDAKALAEETGLLERVRKAIAENDPALALALLDSYRAKFPAGDLTREAEILRARAQTSVPLAPAKP